MKRSQVDNSFLPKKNTYTTVDYSHESFNFISPSTGLIFSFTTIVIAVAAAAVG